MPRLHDSTYLLPDNCATSELQRPDAQMWSVQMILGLVFLRANCSLQQLGFFDAGYRGKTVIPVFQCPEYWKISNSLSVQVLQ